MTVFRSAIVQPAVLKAVFGTLVQATRRDYGSVRTASGRLFHFEQKNTHWEGWFANDPDVNLVTAPTKLALFTKVNANVNNAFR